MEEVTGREEVALLLRRVYPGLIARLFAVTRDLPAAEDVVQDAIEQALRLWPTQGLPSTPAAWLVTVARNQYTDRLRRRAREARHADAVTALADACPWSSLVEPGWAEQGLGWDDDLLRLLFTCCDPVLGAPERTALTLATVVGMSTEEVARAFLVSPRAMEQRLTRARRRLRQRKGSYQVPEVAASHERLDAVLAVVYLTYNEGFWSAKDDEPVRRGLCQLGLGLARSLHALLPQDPEVSGLLALLLLHEARLPARLGPDGTPIPLPEQDRSLWERGWIEEGSALLHRALAQGAPGPYQIEAAIAAVHCSARAASDTNWAQIAALYDALEAVRPSPVVRINRAFAVARSGYPETALALLASIEEEPTLRGSPYPHLVRGAVLEELGRREEAATALRRAAYLARNTHERAQIEQRLQALLPRSPDG